MIPRRILCLALAPYVLWLIVAYQYHLLDGVNLLLHEAGHVVFGVAGEFLHFLGGTLGQLFFPIAFVVYFWRRRERFEAAVCGDLDGGELDVHGPLSWRCPGPDPAPGGWTHPRLALDPQPDGSSTKLHRHRRRIATSSPPSWPSSPGCTVPASCSRNPSRQTESELTDVSAS